jgi:hypothetical protein
MNKISNFRKLLRTLGILILFLNIVPIMTVSATTLYIYAMSNSNVYIDGQFKGVPSRGMLETSASLGTHTIKVTAPKYYDYVGTIDVVQRGFQFVGTTMLPLPLSEPTPTYNPRSTPTPVPTYIPPSNPTPTPIPTTVPSSYKEIRSVPSGANVYYGSTLIGTTPFTYNLPYTQILTFKLAGYSDKVTYIEPSTPSPFVVYSSK